MTDISDADEREAREWLRNKADHRTHPYSDKCRTIIALLDAVEASQRETRTVPDDVVLALVSQARQRARDAALEEALSASGVIDFLRFEVEQAGGQKEWALANGVSPQLVNDVLHGRRAPSAKICKPLGLVRTTRYVRAPRGAA